ncbi:hypothetical protein EVAR_78368_1 [Eumeta japonica]|uniref:Uncharacterized protein n=1 Tax=Eumeta variegata TaxID=151549 RepID=A0A4C1T608_EUMVA|nr:hypothetical protein EVAR_78368_1 [Eumeta japonica]
MGSARPRPHSANRRSRSRDLNKRGGGMNVSSGSRRWEIDLWSLRKTSLVQRRVRGAGLPACSHFTARPRRRPPCVFTFHGAPAAPASLRVHISRRARGAALPACSHFTAPRRRPPCVHISRRAAAPASCVFTFHGGAAGLPCVFTFHGAPAAPASLRVHISRRARGAGLPACSHFTARPRRRPPCVFTFHGAPAAPASLRVHISRRARGAGLPACSHFTARPAVRRRRRKPASFRGFEDCRAASRYVITLIRECLPYTRLRSIQYFVIKIVRGNGTK